MENSGNKERVYLWDNLKVVLIIFVVTIHSVVVYEIAGARWISYLWVFMMSFTMPLFTIISGYWYKENLFLNNTIKLLYPCILFSIINFAIGYFCGAYPEGIPFPKPGYAMWYIWALFCYSLITPVLLRFFNIKTLILLSFIVVFIFGFKFFSENILNAQRVLNFYPFYCIGIWLKNIKISETKIKRGGCCILFVVVVLIHLLLVHFNPGFCYSTMFVSSHGLHIGAFIARWIAYPIALALSLLLIFIVPNKKYWFSKYGTKTMNVYLLHMIVVFPLSWWLFRPIMNEWYGLLIYVVGVPFLCLFLFSEFIDKIMKHILNFPRIFIK